MKHPTSPIIVIFLTIILLGTMLVLPPTDGTPSVVITSPADGFLSLSSTINLTGSATGSDDIWNQTSASDFSSGAFEETEGTNGTVELNQTRMPIYDDFDDNNLDLNLWNLSQQSNISITEENSQLRINGTGCFPGSKMNITSTWYVPSAVSIDLISLSGKDYILRFYLFQDSKDFAGFEIWDAHNQTTQISNVYWSYWRKGIWDQGYLGTLPNGTNNFRVVLDNDMITFYMNDNKQYSAILLPMNITIQIDAIINGTGGWIDAYLDNARWGYLYSESGNFTSNIYDTGAVDPVLKSVRWNASVPNATDFKIQVRASENPDMSNPTPWATVTNNQSAGFPAIRRYLQYRATLASLDGLATPSFKDIEIVYSKPVAKVEVSIDNNATWIPAIGTESWSVSLVLPDNTNLVWVKVTDVAGEIAVASRRIEVDTTAPLCSIVIDDGASFSLDRDVRLALNATDDYGVASMIVGEDSTFASSHWVVYAPISRLWLSDGDGLKTVYARFRDANGWESAMCNDSILVDTQPPVGSVLIDGGAEFTRNTTVTLTFEAVDPIGVTAMQVSNTLDFSRAQWMDYVTSLSWHLVADSGEKSVYARFKDAGGHVSQPVNDSIVADFEAPSVAVTLNGGAAFTRYTNITVDLVPTENYRPSQMQVREGDVIFPQDKAWTPYQTSTGMNLSPTDGYKTVSARLMDAAGNIGPSGFARIILDTTAPVTTITDFPNTFNKASISITWRTTDAFSGVLWYDVQSRTGDGPWTDLLVHTCATSVVLAGENGKTYSFRVRAQDRAGNIEDFLANVEKTVTIRLPMSAPTITAPAQNATVSGKVKITGRCRADIGGILPTQVLVRVDDGQWQPAGGTANWSFNLDTTKLEDGNHFIRVRSFDGSQYSADTVRALTVKNTGARGIDPVPVLASGLVIAIIVVSMMALMRRTRPATEAQPSQEMNSQDTKDLGVDNHRSR